MDFEIEKTPIEPKTRTLKRKVPREDQYEELDASKYYSTHLVEYKQPVHCGWGSIKVLEFLNGKPWDNIALAYVHSLRPSSIRVTKGSITLDSRIWRVTVFVDDDNIIESVSQEVEVGLPKEVRNSEALGVALEYGIDSPQAQWYNDDDIEGFMVDGINGIYYKMTSNGMIPYPKPEEKEKQFTDAERLDFVLDKMKLTDIDAWEGDAFLEFKEYVPFGDISKDKRNLIDWLIKDNKDA